MARGKRPVSFRTRKLSLSAPMVLPRGRGGRVGRRRTTIRNGGQSHVLWPPLSFVRLLSPRAELRRPLMRYLQLMTTPRRGAGGSSGRDDRRGGPRGSTGRTGGSSAGSPTGGRGSATGRGGPAGGGSRS